MKKMIISMFIALAVSVQCVMSDVTTNVSSQDNPLWMVSSKDAMTSYAISRVNRGSVSVWAPTSVYGDESFTNSAYCELPFGERNDAFKVLDLLKQQQLYFSVVRPDVDQINSYLGLYSDDGWCMFYGYGYGNLSKDEFGNWFSPQSLLKFESYLNWDIPILSNVSQAKVVLRDKDGNITSTVWLDTNWNGQLIFRRDFIGQNGDIIVSMKDGSSIAASLSDNKIYQIIGVPAKIDSSINNVVLFDTDAEKLVVNPKSYEGYGDSPLVRGTFTQMQWFTLGANTTEGEIPLGVWYRNVETSSVDDWQYLPVSNITINFGNNTKTGNIEIEIGLPGTYEFRFDWKFFGPRPINYYYDGGGKG